MRIALSVAVLLAVVAGVLYWGAHSERVLRWGLARAVAKLPCSADVEGVTGTLVSPIRIRRITCTGADVRFEATRLELAWSLTHLARREVDVQRLRIGSLTIVSRSASSAPPALPDSLALPIPVRVAALDVGHLVVRTGDRDVALRDITATYRGGTRDHELTLGRLHTQWGEIRARVRVGARAPFPVDASVHVQGSAAPDWPVAGDGTLSGPLANLAVAVRATVRGLPVVAHATVAPFRHDRLPALTVDADGLDVHEWFPSSPRTKLSVSFDGAAKGSNLTGTVAVRNAIDGPVDSGRLPVRSIDARATLAPGHVVLENARMSLGKAGTATGHASVEGGKATVSLHTDDLDLRGLHGALRQTHLRGDVTAALQSARQTFSVDLREQDMRVQALAGLAGGELTVDRLTARAGHAELSGSGHVTVDDRLAFSFDGALHAFDPAQFGDFPQARIDGTFGAEGHVRPDWEATVRYVLADSRFDGQPLSGQGRLTVAAGRIRDAAVKLALGSNRLALNGAFGQPGDTLRFRVRAPELRQLHLGAEGALRATGHVSGTLEQPNGDVTWNGRQLRYGSFRVKRWTGSVRIARVADPTLSLESRLQQVSRTGTTLDSVEVKADGRLSRHDITLALKGPKLDVQAEATGGYAPKERLWSGVLERLVNTGPLSARLEQPVSVQVGSGHLVLGRTTAEVAGGRIVLEEARYLGGVLESSGSLKGMPLAALLPPMHGARRIESTLRVGGRWSVRAGDTIDGKVDVAREQGDVTIVSDGASYPLGLSTAKLAVQSRGDALNGVLTLRGEAVTLDAHGNVPLSRHGDAWGIAGTSPIDVHASAHVDTLAPLSALVGTSFSATGSVDLKLEARGTVADPRLDGTLAAAGLGLERIENGVILHDGTLDARFQDSAIVLKSFHILGGDGRLEAKGRLDLAGDKPGGDLEWSASHLAAIQHPDLLLIASGSGKVALSGTHLRLSGSVNIDRGRVNLPDQLPPSLGDDVVVGSKDTPAEARPPGSTYRPEVDMTVDIGRDFLVQGRGIDAKLVGKVTVTGSGKTALDTKGEISVAYGTYRAYGRKLDIDKGVLYFSGPYDNPGLEIRAMRKNQAVEAGVEIQGTVRNPRVQLVSNPEVSDPEKLAWLVLGKPAGSAGTTDSDKLQGAAVALAAGLGTSPLQRQLAKAIGLDEIRFAPTTSSTGQQSGLLTVGKRIGDRIYVAYQQSLTTAENVVRVSYKLSNNWSLRTESGTTDAVDIFYTLSFD